MSAKSSFRLDALDYANAAGLSRILNRLPDNCLNFGFILIRRSTNWECSSLRFFCPKLLTRNCLIAVQEKKTFHD